MHMMAVHLIAQGSLTIESNECDSRADEQRRVRCDNVHTNTTHTHASARQIAECVIIIIYDVLKSMRCHKTLSTMVLHLRIKIAIKPSQRKRANSLSECKGA